MIFYNISLYQEQSVYILSTRASWTKEEATQGPLCCREGDDNGCWEKITQETANFDNCVSGTVVENYEEPYDFESIMHARKDE